MEGKEGDTYKYGAYFNRTQNQLTIPVKMVKI